MGFGHYDPLTDTIFPYCFRRLFKQSGVGTGDSRGTLNYGSLALPNIRQSLSKQYVLAASPYTLAPHTRYWIEITTNDTMGQVYWAFSSDLLGTTGTSGEFWSANGGSFVYPDGTNGGPPQMEVSATGQTQYQLTISASPVAGGAVIPASGVYDYAPGTVVAITAAPNAGYQFTGWTGPAANPNNASTTVTMSAAESAPKEFHEAVATQYQLTTAASPVAGGSVMANPSSASGLYNAGTAVTLTAAPNAGYQFTRWTGPAANPNNASTTVTMSAAAEFVTANFTAVATHNISSPPRPLLSRRIG